MGDRKARPFQGEGTSFDERRRRHLRVLRSRRRPHPVAGSGRTRLRQLPRSAAAPEAARPRRAAGECLARSASHQPGRSVRRHHRRRAQAGPNFSSSSCRRTGCSARIAARSSRLSSACAGPPALRIPRRECLSWAKAMSIAAPARPNCRGRKGSFSTRAMIENDVSADHALLQSRQVQRPILRRTRRSRERIAAARDPDPERRAGA